jgi:heme/copper-type cytochrome/quinol oxidase subunit 2
VKEQINAAIKTLIYGVIAASAGCVAFLFAVIAAFLWVQQRYDTIVASGVVGGMFLLVAVIALISLSVARRRAAKRQAREAAEEARAAPSWLADPAILLTAFQVARSIGFGKIIPLALAGAAAFGAAGMMGKGSAAKRENASRETKRAA